ncbi:MAG: phage tail family protein [Chloroflexota bacterium]|nr:phage tail family protein [Chloroflexota bacterium]
MREIYLDNYHLYSLTTPRPTSVSQPLEGLEDAETRLDVYNNPGAAGQTVANALAGGRTVVLDGSLHGSGATEASALADYLLQRRLLIAAVSHTYDAAGRLVPRILKFTDLDGRQYRLSVVKRRFTAPRELPTYNRWQLELVATKAVVESETLASLTLTLPISGGSADPFVYPRLYGASSGGSGNAINEGNADASPVITFTGPIPNPSLTNELTGERLALNLVLAAGDVVTVDTDGRTIVQGTSTNRMGARASGSTFWKLPPGSSPLRFAADAYDTGTATITWRSSFNGV